MVVTMLSFSPPKQITLRVSVARSSSRVRKLCTGSTTPSSGPVRLLAALRVRLATLGLGHRRRVLCPSSRPVVVVEQQRRQLLAHVPFQVIGQHAQQHMRPHTCCRPVEHRAQFQIHGFHAAEGALDPGEALVGAHGRGGIGLLGRQAGAHDVNAVELRLSAIVLALRAKLKL